MKVYPLGLGMYGTNCYILSFEGRAVIIDPAENPERIFQHLNANNLEPEAIFITHGHFDHIGAVNEVATKFNIPVYAHQKEQEYFEKAEINQSTMLRKLLRLKSDLQYRYVEDNEVIKCLGTEAVAKHVPGHTPGSLCYYFAKEQVVFTGDTLFKGSIGRTDFKYGNHQQLISALKEKILTLPPETIVYPGHNSCTTILDELNKNPFFA